MDDDAGSNSAQPAPATAALVKRLDATKGGKFVRFLQRRKCWIVAVYAVVLVTCGYFGPQLFSNTSEVFYAPKGTPSYTNNNIVKSLFPESLKSTQLVVYIRTINGSSVLVPAVEQFTMDLNRTLYELAPSPGFVREVEGYYLLRAMGLPASALQKFVSKDGAATMIVFEIAAYAVGKPAQNYATTLMSAMEGIAPAGGKQDVTLLGAPAFLGPSTKAVEMDMATMDGICIPIALFILWFMLRTWRLMLVPLATVIISALVSFAIMYGVSFKLRVFTVVPSLMMSLVLAVSIDYSLFLLVRYRVELSKGTPHVQAVIQMTRFAGHTIAISGIVLSMCFFGICIFPLQSIQTMGIGCGVVVLTTLIANQTLLPVILLSFPRFFEQSATSACYEAVARVVSTMCCFCCARKQRTPSTRDFAKLSDGVSPINSAATKHGRDKSLWYRSGRLLVRWPYNLAIVAVVVAATVPFALHAFNVPTSYNMLMDLPRGAKSTNAFIQMIDDFGYGTVFPYTVMFKANPNQQVSNPNEPAVLQDEYFLNVQRAVEEWQTYIPHGSEVTYEGIMYNSGKPVNASTIAACLKPQASIIPACKLVQQLYAQVVNTDQTASLVTATPSLFITETEGRQWLSAMRASIQKFQDATGIETVLVGLGADSIDIINAVFDRFPLMVGITCTLVLLVMGASFQSVLIPLRSIVTIALSLMFTFGFANLTYEHGALNWLHIAGLANQGSIMWLSPLTTFVIIVGIGLDYDVFLTVSIVEQRDKGHTTHEAIARGLFNTGYVITAAGVIMAIAFVGLVLASITTLNQFGFYLVFAVLFDTFVVRSLLVPALMGALNDANWWPAHTNSCTSCSRPTIRRASAASASLMDGSSAVYGSAHA